MGITIHGVMTEVFDSGVLIKGESGIGKSECALDLITRGHRLIADDAVSIKKNGETLYATAPELTRELLEIRGFGIINVREVFGKRAIRKGGKIDLCIELREWNESGEIDPFGHRIQGAEIMELSIPKRILYVRFGHNVTTLVETAVRVFELKREGKDASAKLIEKHLEAVSDNK